MVLQKRFELWENKLPSGIHRCAKYKAIIYQQVVSLRGAIYYVLCGTDSQNAKVTHFSSLSVSMMSITKLQFWAISFGTIQKCSLISFFNKDRVSLRTGNSNQNLAQCLFLLKCFILPCIHIYPIYTAWHKWWRQTTMLLNWFCYLPAVWLWEKFWTSLCFSCLSFKRV